MLYDIDKIIVKERKRKKFVLIEELARSIERYGLLQPIVISSSGELLAGERRLRAHQYLKITQIEVIFKNDLSPIEQKMVELEENLRREDMTWQEYAAGYYDIHNTYLMMHPNEWNITKTSEELGVSPATISIYIRLHRAIQQGIKDVAECRTYKSAQDTLMRWTERSLMKELGKRQIDNVFKNQIVKNAQEKGDLEQKIEYIPAFFHLGDCIDLIRDFPNGSIRLILTDPIWGVDIDLQGKFDKYRAHFIDAPHILQRMIPRLCEEYYRVLVENSHIYIFTPILAFTKWQEHLQNAGFDVRSQPLIWVKEGGGFTNADLKYMPRWESILFATKGSLPIAFPYSDVFEFSRPPQEERYVPTQKPIPLLRKIISLSSIEGDTVLDTFCGSGSTVVAAYLERRIGIGLEINEDIINIAKYFLKETKQKIWEKKEN